MSQESPKAKKIFKWIDRNHLILERQRSFYESKEFLDVTLIAGPESVQLGAHRVILCSSSDYLLSALRSSNSPEIKLPAIDGVTAKKIVDFMYTGSIEMSLETVRTIIEAATLLQMKTLIDACCDFMEEHLDASNCLGIARFAKQHNYAKLFEKASSFAHENFDQVSMGKEFAELTEEELIVFLSSEDPQSKDENLFSRLYKVLERKFEVDKGLTISNTNECYKSYRSWLLSKFAPKGCSQFLVFVSGKTGDALKMQIFNRLLNSWSYENVPPLPASKKGYGVMVMNKKLIIIGGTLEIINNVECLDLKTKEDTNSVECLNLETKQWSYLPPMKHKRHASGVAELNGDLYVIGGKCDEEAVTFVERYNFGTGKWQDVKPLNFALDPLISTAVLDGKLYVTDNNYGVMQCYDPIEDQWTEKTPRTERVKWFSIAAVGPYIYAVGGANNEATSTVERYNPATDSWTYVAPVKEPMADVRCTSFNNRLIALGGDIGGNWVDTVQEYHPETDEWKTLTPFIGDEWDHHMTNSDLFAI